MSLLVSLSFFSLLAPLLFSIIHALPVRVRQGDGFSVLSQDDIEGTFLRPALFARMAYCDITKIPDLSCGGPCDPLKDDVEVLTSGGNGEDLPQFVVAHDRSDNSIVVSHEGTSSDSAESILGDLNFGLVPLNTNKFPDFQDKGAEVHDGFQTAFYGAADQILTTVKDALVSKNSTKVVITGHSLGGALSVMDAIMFKQFLDPSIEIKTITFGTPRGGNQEWADLVDQTLGDNQRFMTNQNDIVPQLPPSTFFGFRHSAGEVHITGNSDSEVVSCPGQENDDVRCSFGDTGDGGALLGFLPDINISQHKGPYFNDISFGHSQCPE